MACARYQQPWTLEEEQRVAALWRDGFSSGAIARAMDNKRSRNAVVGKLLRLGLIGAGPEKPRRQKKSEHIRNRLKNVRAGRTVPRAPKAPAQRSAAHLPLREALILSLPPTEPRRDIGSIDHGECRFMCGDPRDAAHAFCARPTDGATAWCRHHRWLVTAPEQRPALERCWRDELQQQVGVGV